MEETRKKHGKENQETFFYFINFNYQGQAIITGIYYFNVICNPDSSISPPVSSLHLPGSLISLVKELLTQTVIYSRKKTYIRRDAFSNCHPLNTSEKMKSPNITESGCSSAYVLLSEKGIKDYLKHGAVFWYIACQNYAMTNPRYWQKASNHQSPCQQKKM